MNEFAKSLLGSKKAIAAIVGILLVIARKLGVPLDPDDMLALVTVIAGYLVGQGHADAGKSAEQVRQSTTTTTTATASMC